MQPAQTGGVRVQRSVATALVDCSTVPSGTPAGVVGDDAASTPSAGAMDSRAAAQLVRDRVGDCDSSAWLSGSGESGRSTNVSGSNRKRTIPLNHAVYGRRSRRGWDSNPRTSIHPCRFSRSGAGLTDERGGESDLPRVHRDAWCRLAWLQARSASAGGGVGRIRPGAGAEDDRARRAGLRNHAVLSQTTRPTVGPLNAPTLAV
jgi:hypothetical protein